MSTNRADVKRAVSQWAERIGVEVQEVHLRSMQRKWASISSKGRLTLNTDLLSLPETLDATFGSAPRRRVINGGDTGLTRTIGHLLLETRKVVKVIFCDYVLCTAPLSTKHAYPTTCRIMQPFLLNSRHVG